MKQVCFSLFVCLFCLFVCSRKLNTVALETNLGQAEADAPFGSRLRAFEKATQPAPFVGWLVDCLVGRLVLVGRSVSGRLFLPCFPPFVYCLVFGCAFVWSTQVISSVSFLLFFGLFVCVWFGCLLRLFDSLVDSNLQRRNLHALQQQHNNNTEHPSALTTTSDRRTTVSFLILFANPVKPIHSGR